MNNPLLSTVTRQTAAAARRLQQTARSATSPATNPPNVLFIIADDLNSWIGALGRHPSVKTPNIDALAARGTLFTHAYCSAPYCNASRMGIFTGCLPTTTGIYQDESFWDRTHRPITFVERLRESGYHTVGGGKVFHGVFDYAAAGQTGADHAEWREVENRPELWVDFLTNEVEPLPDGRPLNRLFDFGNFAAVPKPYHHFDWGPLPDDRVNRIPDEKVMNYVCNFLSETPPEPFFCAAGLYKPHLPWHVPARFFDLYDPNAIALPLVRADDLDDVPPIGRDWALSPPDHERITGAGQWGAAVHGYLAAISYCDHLVGEIVSALDRSGLANRTIIVLCGDNGFHLGEKLHWRKFALWEEATRVPLIISAPAVQDAPKRVYQPVSLIDIYPTMLRLCGLDCPPVDGMDLVPLLFDRTGSVTRPPAVMTWGRGNHSVRTAEWRLIRYHDGSEELYDHRADPFEWQNLAGSVDLEEVRTELRQAIPEHSQSPNSSGRRPGPDFLGIGAQKAGTTWLYERLKRHPDIYVPPEKELHFWDQRQDQPISEWLDLFDEVTEQKRGEITPAYGILDTDTIREIYELRPDLRLFYSIRNPIERAWSSALMALERAEMTFNEASDMWFIDHFKSSGSQRRGDAESCLSRWRSVFPTEQIHLILYDDLALYPLDTLLKLASHLGVEGEFFRSIPEDELKEHVFAGPGHSLRPSLRRFLTILYARKIERLQGILDRDLSHWLPE
jgi:arylsulfatase A-like enzyme